MIELEQISKTFPGGETALHPTTLAFEKGSFTVLLGPSGAGKSTLLRMINLLHRPSSGRLRVEGFGQLEKASGLILRQHRRSTAMIFQSHQLIGRFSVLENVLIGCLGKHSSLRTLLPLSRKEIKNALGCLDRLEILDKANERVDNLSGGQRQRVGIARGLVQNPRIMLADEPVASLDPVTSEKTLKLMKTICKEDGLTAIVSLHQLDLAIRFADRIVALCKGRVIYDGLPESLDNTHIEKIYRSKESQPAGESTTYGTSEKHAV
jgi:phosphonate transport system ATP-binding protein